MMITIDFNNEKLFIPSGWGDIKLGDYEKWYLMKPENNLEFIQYVADICKIDAKLLLNAPTELFNIIVNSLYPILNGSVEPKSSIEIDNIVYKIERSERLTLGEWVDIENVFESDSGNKISEALAIVCRPDNESYNPDRFEERKVLFQNATCDKVLALFAFFLSKEKRLSEILNHCSNTIILGNRLVEDIEIFRQSGDGIKRLPIWQRIRFIYLTKSLKKQLTRFSDSYYINLTSQMPRSSK